VAAATVRRRLACLRVFFRRLTKLGSAKDLFGNWRLDLPRRKRLPRALSRSETSSLLVSFAPPARLVALLRPQLLRGGEPVPCACDQ
jgi:integrase/recombinase XerD